MDSLATYRVVIQTGGLNIITRDNDIDDNDIKFLVEEHLRMVILYTNFKSVPQGKIEYKFS